MHGVRGADRDDMLVNMIPVHVVQMAVMKIVNMAVMANSRMPAVRAMLVDMVGMLPLGAGGHEILLLLRLRSRCLCLSAGPLVWALAGLCALILWWQLFFPMVVAPVSMRRIDRRADSISAAMREIADPARYGKNAVTIITFARRPSASSYLTRSFPRLRPISWTHCVRHRQSESRPLISVF